MKAVSAQAMAELEKKAYQQGCCERDFMENAGRGVAQAVEQYVDQHRLERRVHLLCGKGNNGGDAFVAGCHLLERGFRVKAIQLNPLDTCSPLCRENGKRFLAKNGEISQTFDFSTTSGILLDGLFGTGFKGSVRSPYSTLIDAANQSKLPILSIDIPSGLDGTTGSVEGGVIHASETIFLGLPKTGFFLNHGWNVVGKLHGVNFGLPNSIIEETSAEFKLLTDGNMAALLPPLVRDRHKYQAGDVVGLAGSPSMPGAALLSTLSAFRGGSGMVKLLHPIGMEAQLAASPYELIKIPYSDEEKEKIISLINQAGGSFIGPGLGRSQAIADLLQRVVPSLDIPCVLDADALSLFAAHPFKLPAQTVFTPHLGEMQTLFGSKERLVRDGNLLKRCQQYVEEKNVTLILKGAPTFIFHPGELPSANPTGDPGMATAGSGDVLTGLLASLLSQGIERHAATCLAVYLHGLAGEFAAKARKGSRGMIASDLISHFDDAYASLHAFNPVT